MIKVNETVKSELDALKNEFRLVKSSLAELKSENFQTLQMINNKMNNAIASSINCFRCNGRILEYIQLQCGYIFCLYCVHFILCRK